MPPAKAVCRDLLISFESMAYVMRYNRFPSTRATGLPVTATFRQSQSGLSAGAGKSF